MSMRTIAQIDADIKKFADAREARAAIQSEDGKWDEGRAVFIENCSRRIAELAEERRAALGS